MVRKTFEFNVFSVDQNETLRIEEILSEETKYRKSLGTAYGIDIGHCIYLGIRHSEKFAERVKYYKIIEDDKQLEEMRRFQPRAIGVEFYE